MRRGLERLSLGRECSVKGSRCYSSYYYCLHHQQQKAEHFEHRLEMLTSGMISNIGPLQPFPLLREWSHSQTPLPQFPTPHDERHTSRPSETCLLLLSSLFPLSDCGETGAASRKMIKGARRPPEATPASPLMPEQFSSAPKLPGATQAFTRPVGLWAYILSWWLKAHLLWYEHIFGGFALPSQAYYQFSFYPVEHPVSFYLQQFTGPL